MSDSIKKYHEMVEDGRIEDKKSSRTVFQSTLLTDEEKKEAYKILAYYDTKVVLHAASIINNDSSL